MFKNIEDQILFLKICEKNGSLDNIVSRGYSYLEIVDMLEWAIKKKYVFKAKDKIYLSALGKEKLKSLFTGKRNWIWIGKKNDVIIPKMDLYDIYLRKDINHIEESINYLE